MYMTLTSFVLVTVGYVSLLLLSNPIKLWAVVDIDVAQDKFTESHPFRTSLPANAQIEIVGNAYRSSCSMGTRQIQQVIHFDLLIDLIALRPQ